MGNFSAAIACHFNVLARLRRPQKQLKQTMKRPNKAEMATPNQPSDQILAFPRSAIPLTFAKEMEESFIRTFLDFPQLGALIALKPMSYVIRIGLAIVAFGAAMNVDKVVARVIGFVWLLITGAGLLFVGFQNGTAVDIILGLVALGGAGYSWWYTR